MTIRFTKSAHLLALLLLLTALSAFADVQARIRGTVTDPSGAIVPNATLTATNTQTGVSYTTKSTANGTYEFLNLPVGTYNVSAEAGGFQKFTANGITLNIDQNYLEDIKLAVGNTSETVEVQASAVQVDTSNIQLSNIVNTEQIVDLPLIGRNFTQLEQILPGVQASSDRFGTFSVNGSQSQQSSFLINGQDTNDAPLNTIVFTPSPDAIQQFNLVTSSLNPEYARNSGAIVSATIKNGTNHFHGDAFEFYRDTFLNTRNYFQKTAPKFHQNLFGGTLGGPIWRDKAFFFLSYQGLRAKQPQTGGNVNVFTSAQRGGDFSGDLASGVLTSNPVPGTLNIPGCPAGTPWNTCLTNLNGVIPTSSFNPISATLLGKYVPLPNSGTNTFIFNPIQQSIQDQGIARFDVTPTNSDQFWGVYTRQHAPSLRDLPFTGGTLPGFGDTNKSEVYQYNADWAHTFSSTALNEVRLGYTRFNFDAVEPQQPVQPSSAGFAINPQNKVGSGLPLIGVTGLFSLGFSSNGPQPRIDQTYEIVDNFSKVYGKHSMKFGYDGRRFNVNNPFFNSNNGNFSFGGQGAFSTGDPGLDFLLGIPDSFTQGAGGRIDAYAYEHYLYGQDQWKVTNNFTATLGLGWQIDTPYHNRQFKGLGVTCFVPGAQSTVFPTAPVGLLYPKDKGCNDASGATTAWKDVGPRVGFAYSPSWRWLSGGDAHKFSIRGGYGVYFNRTEEETSLQNLGDPPFGVTSGGAATLGGTNPSFANPYQDIDTGQTFNNLFPASFPQPGQPVDFTTFEPFSLSQYNKHFRIPYAQNFNLTLQRELPSNAVLTLSYVGSLGRREQVIYEGNPITQAGHDACLASASCRANRNFQSLLFPSHTQFGNGDIFSSIGEIDTIGSSSYHSFQASVTKNYSHGLYLQASYTWSHAIDNASSFENSGFGSAGERGFNQFFPNLNVGDSEFDARHRFVISPVYDIPNWASAPGLHWLPGVIGKGWQISGISTFATGFPFDISYAGSTSRALWCSAALSFYACPDVPLQVGAYKQLDPRSTHDNTKAFWFDKTAFAAEPIGSFGNVHRNPAHGPGINNTDMLLAKKIYWWGSNESRYLQLRLESYNVFNHTQFNNPTSNFASGNFGRITTAKAGRQTQLGVKIYF